MRKNLEKRLSKLGYILLPKMYSWSQWKVIVGPEYPTFIRYFDNLKQVEVFTKDEECLGS